MKKALRTVVPLLLILAVLASAVWYFLIYDRELTKDIILWGARTLEESGKHDQAAKLYDLAYSHSGREDAVAIELSRQYRDYGNYTKAEYTLAQAISGNPTTALYMALSQLYVEQDKLLDAVNMLDTVNDPAIQAELAAQRPQVPTVTYEPGFYSQYISVEVQWNGGMLYVSRDGDFPSTADDLYTGPITLPAGETKLHCLCIGDNGLVSPLGLYTYTVGGVVEPVSFTDKAIEAAIREQLSSGTATTLYTNDLWALKEFTVPADAESYADLALLTRLESLTAEKASQGLLTQMGTVPSLKSLSLPGSRLNREDLAVLSSLTALESLDLSGCGLSSITALAPLVNLKSLDLGSNALRNLSPLAGIPTLEALDLSRNAVTDLSALSALVNLKRLDLSYNSLTGLTPICGIPALTELKASHNQISSIDSVKQLTGLTLLDLSHNRISQVTALKSCTALTELNIASNSISDISALSALLSLSNLNCSHNSISEFPSFGKKSALVTIDCSHNRLSSVAPMGNLPALNTVNVDYNEAITSLQPLDNCHVLIQVNAHGTQVTEVKFLTDKSVVVNYDPTV